MKRTSHPALIAASAALALSVVLTGCADKGTSTAGSETTASAGASNVDAAALLASAAEAAKKVTSTHFTVDVAGKVPNLPLSKVDGDLRVKPSTQAQGTAVIQPGNAEGKFTFIDGHMYASLYGDKYADYGDGASIYDVSALFDEAKGIPNILTKVTGAKAAGTETIGGQETTKITGTVPATEIATISGSRVDPAKSVPVPTTLWIQNSGDKQLVRIEVKPSTEGTITLTFSKWGQTVSVTKPDVTPVETTSNPGPGESLPR
ncbi:LppX_LprAFG lipoprotein [Tsukamurella asaccharolytica]|uniref:LppX_LprAFG lipoprotein n=1 Tax=Tsukamurella asaccharolytica TaxID=2592067 RepID=A0A5C5R725_9ACTN|nr:LppX_LprAFG lipoprotein [Tsukamurella asaccharolytica]TWS18879.1 LppX_LprAFG lipoprotein [Tsukamurella asaccharolytica]